MNWAGGTAAPNLARSSLLRYCAVCERKTVACAVASYASRATRKSLWRVLSHGSPRARGDSAPRRLATVENNHGGLQKVGISVQGAGVFAVGNTYRMLSTASSGKKKRSGHRREEWMPASDVDPKAKGDEDRIAHLCVDGRHGEAIEALQAIRERGLTPSVVSYMEVVTVCRRALEWDKAVATYRGMVDAHLPADVFEEFACDDAKDESESVLSRAFRLVLMMRTDGVRPDFGTYRVLMHYCKDDGCWQLAVLLMEEAFRSRNKLDLFSFDLLLSIMSNHGYTEVGTMLYELGVVEGDRDLLEVGVKDAYDMDWPFKTGTTILELHNLTESTALATVRIALLDVVRKPRTRHYWNGAGQKPLRIITGMGNNSKHGAAVIKPAVVGMLEDMGLKPEFQQGNEGCIEVTAGNLKAYGDRLISASTASSTSR